MNFNDVVRLPLFKSVSPSELENIFSTIKLTETYFAKGDTLALQDEPCNRLIILLEGSVKAEMSAPSGKVIKVEDIAAPNPLAILFLFGQNNRFPVQVTALENITALIIPKQSVLKLLGMNEAILTNYLDISANFASRLSKKLHFMSFRTIRQKLAMYLLELAQRNGSNIAELDRSKSSLAEYFGVSRPSLERELTNMQEDELIKSEKKKITLIDIDTLKQLINF